MTNECGRARNWTTQAIGFRAEQDGDPAKKPIERLFNPEFRNRLDAIVAPLTHFLPETIKQIVDKQIGEFTGGFGFENMLPWN